MKTISNKGYAFYKLSRLLNADGFSAERLLRKATRGLPKNLQVTIRPQSIRRKLGGAEIRVGQANLLFVWESGDELLQRSLVMHCVNRRGCQLSNRISPNIAYTTNKNGESNSNALVDCIQKGVAAIASQRTMKSQSDVAQVSTP